MKCFRVRDAQTVENFLTVDVLDGVAYVPTGGLQKPYVRANEELRSAIGETRRISNASLLDGMRSSLILTPENAEDAHKALVVIPCSRAYHYTGLSRAMQPVSHTNDNLAITVVLEPGQSITAMPIVRTLAESAQMKPFAIGFDGENVFVRSDA
jgi:hypothetical protein